MEKYDVVTGNYALKVFHSPVYGGKIVISALFSKTQVTRIKASKNKCIYIHRLHMYILCILLPATLSTHFVRSRWGKRQVVNKISKKKQFYLTCTNDNS